MAGGCLAGAGAALFRHPSFWAEDEEAAGPSLQEDPRSIGAEVTVYNMLVESGPTPFVTNLDEASVNCGLLQPELAKQGRPLQRLKAAGTEGFGWRDCRAVYEASMAAENRTDRFAADADPAAAEKRVTGRLLMARLEPVPLRGRGQGNSQFEAVSFALFGTPAYHGLLRQWAVEFMRGEPEEYAPLLGDDFPAYLAAMARQGAGGDELTLRALGDHLGVAVNIVTADAFMWMLRYAPRQTKSRREVFVAFVPPGTWAPIRRQSALTTLKLSITHSSELKAARESRRKLQVEYAGEGSTSGGGMFG